MYLSDFELVDENGVAVGAGVQGLLLYKGGTVCDDRFSDNSAEAICRLLGYGSHSSWTSGQKWGIQSVLDIHMDDVRCTSGYWNSCTYDTSYHHCYHHEDIFLVCNKPGEKCGHGHFNYHFQPPSRYSRSTTSKILKFVRRLKAMQEKTGVILI